MNDTKSLVDRFHEAHIRLLREHPEQALAQYREMKADLGRGHAIYAGKTLEFLFHPFVLDRPGLDRMARAAESVTVLAEKVARLYLTQPAIREQIKLDPRLEELILQSPASYTCERAAPVVRFDALVQDETIQFLEVNTDGSSGMNDTNEIEYRLLRCELMQAHEREFHLEVSRLLPPLLASLLEVHASSGRMGSPTVAIVDWSDVQTREEFLALQEHFQAQGCPTIIVDPRELELSRDRLKAGGREIDLVYKRVLTAELLEKWDEVQPLVEGHRRDLFSMAGPILGDVIYDKRVLSVMSNPDNHHFFEAEELTTIDRHLPWTRRARPGPVTYRGRTWQMADLLREERERLVLKPAIGYGGESVTLGPEVPASEWDQLSVRALEGGWVVQEMLPIPRGRFFDVETGRVVEKNVNLGQFVFGGRFAGPYCRISDASVINVSAGGATLPCLTVAEA